MKKENYQAIISVNNSARECTDAISRVQEWWTRNIEGQTTRLHDNFKVIFGETTVDFEIVEMDPAKKIIWLVTDCNLHQFKDKKEWKDTQVLWEIRPLKNSTEIIMIHSGLTPDVECYEMCETGWNFYVKTSLFKLLTEGKGSPDKRHEYVAESA